MNKSKIMLVIMIVSMLLFVVTIGLIISMSKIDKQNEDTTSLFTATVSGIDISDIGEKISAKIHIKEYKTSLQISTNISKYIEMDDVRDLKNGQTIFFRIENIKVEQMNIVEFINIVSLKTNTKDIFSLDEYNKYIYNSAHPTRIASIIIALLFLFTSLFCFLKIKRNMNTK